MSGSAPIGGEGPSRTGKDGADDTKDSIAAIIPLYNGIDFIERALRSVLQQTRQAEEIVVVDDGSSDDGAAIVRREATRDKRIRLISQANAGQSAARNHGVRASRSNLIAFLDQDDWWYPDHLAKLERAFAARRERRLGWVYSDVDEYDRDGSLVVCNFLSTIGGEHPKTSVHTCLGADMYILPSAALVTREAFIAVGGFDERLSGYEDDDLFLRMLRKGYRSCFVPEALSAWRIHSGSASYSPRMARSALVYARKLLEDFPDDGGRKRYFARDLIAPRFLPVALAHYSRTVALGRRQDFPAALESVDMLRTLIPGRRRRRWLAMLRPLMGIYPLARLASALRLHRLARMWI